MDSASNQPARLYERPKTYFEHSQDKLKRTLNFNRS